MTVTHVRYEAPGWGVGELWLADGRVVESHLPRPAPGSPEPPEPDGLGARLHRYFSGTPEDFGDVELELDWCTPFQRALADALRAVPYGETVTYGELAALAGRPGAARAAGTFCAGNRLAVLVPCHRVVAAGGIGGYGSTGVAVKRRLLELERAARR